MPFMVWTSEFEFGIPEIDKQHMHWLMLLNQFYDHLEAKKLKENLLQLLNEAIDYTHYHFSEEEKFMTSIGYPAINEQKRMHHDISLKIEEFKKKLIDDKPVISMTITNEFKSWFRNHILVEDKKYADIYKKHM